MQSRFRELMMPVLLIYATIGMYRLTGLPFVVGERFTAWEVCLIARASARPWRSAFSCGEIETCSASRLTGRIPDDHRPELGARRRESR